MTGEGFTADSKCASRLGHERITQHRGAGLDELETLLVQALEDNARLKAENAELRDEIPRLKGLNGRPTIKPNRPSGMEQATGSAKGQRRKRRRGAKRAKVTITDTTVIKAEGLPKAPASRATRSSWFRT